MLAHFGGDLKGKRIAVWGLAFKPGTDDIREAPALVLIEQLLAAGAKVSATDPVAIEAVRKQLGDRIAYEEAHYECAKGADALVLVTEWHEFRRPSFERLKSLLRQPVIFDGRNVWSPAELRAAGFTYYGMGRGKHSLQPRRGEPSPPAAAAARQSLADAVRRRAVARRRRARAQPRTPPARPLRHDARVRGLVAAGHDGDPIRDRGAARPTRPTDSGGIAYDWPSCMTGAARSDQHREAQRQLAADRPCSGRSRWRSSASSTAGVLPAASGLRRVVLLAQPVASWRATSASSTKARVLKKASFTQLPRLVPGPRSAPRRARTSTPRPICSAA